MPASELIPPSPTPQSLPTLISTTYVPPTATTGRVVGVPSQRQQGSSPTKRNQPFSPTSSPISHDSFIISQKQTLHDRTNDKIIRSKAGGGSTSTRGRGKVPKIRNEDVVNLEADMLMDIGERLEGMGRGGIDSRVPLVGEKNMTDPGQPSSGEVSMVHDSSLEAYAKEQTKKLYAMPLELATTLSKMSSQHRLSDYNVMKRKVSAPTLGAALQAPVSTLANDVARVPILPPSPIRPFIVTRSHSATSPSHMTTSSSLLDSTETSAIGTSSFPLPGNIRHPSPSESTPSTPPPVPVEQEISHKDDLSSRPTLISPRGAVDGELAAALGEALRHPLERNILPSGVACGLANAKSSMAVVLPAGMLLMNGVAVKTSTSHPLNITPMIPEDFLRLCSDSLKFSSSNQPASTQLLMSAATIATRSSLSEPMLARHFAPSIAYPHENKRTYFDLWDYTNKPQYFNQFLAATQRPVAGNFFLSSCPGKKVRLEGGQPRTEGRAAICRSVQVDLERAARNFGVRLVVCCLDDQELAFLGAPWEEYSKAAAALDLEILRLPIIEGFAPPSPAALDAHLERVVSVYSERGHNVLAHCRGGIGRAGLVACCWMIKMGFIRAGRDGNFGEAIKVVERAIDVIRRRRSVKAIETPHQVHFLLEYVTYLKNRAKNIKIGDLQN